MNITRSLFEAKKYPERILEFRRLMAFCDENRLRMTFHDEYGYLGIRVYGVNDEAVTVYSDYTLYYDTVEKKVVFLDSENWRVGMSRLTEDLLQEARKSGESMSLFEPDLEFTEALYEKKKNDRRSDKFDFAVRRDGYSRNVAVFDESKWLAMAQMRKLYPGEKFDFVSGNTKKGGNTYAEPV